MSSACASRCDHMTSLPMHLTLSAVLICACAAHSASATPAIATRDVKTAGGKTRWPVEFVVDAMRGDDGASGTSANQPFRTLARARDAIAQWRNDAGELPVGGARVLVREGEYSPLSLTSADSGECRPPHTHAQAHASHCAWCTHITALCMDGHISH
jgi:hypothetical protein